MKIRILNIILLLVFVGLFAQKKSDKTGFYSVRFRKEICFDKGFFEGKMVRVLDTNDREISGDEYDLDAKGCLVFREGFLASTDTIRVEVVSVLGGFVERQGGEKKYKFFEDAVFSMPLYREENEVLEEVRPFGGLEVSGSMSRGLGVGNNRNGSFRSNIDLSISGNLSDKLRLRANIQDNGLGMENGSYSQSIALYDRIFMELESERWKVSGGDLMLSHDFGDLLRYQKKIQGIAVEIGKKGDATGFSAYVGGGIVRGVYGRNQFRALEGNLGPYKLLGNKGERYLQIISGSERVFANGRLLQRGEDKDYLMDYNAGELFFTSLFAVNSEMRIEVEFQYADRNYERMLGNAGFGFKGKRWEIGSNFYLESDLKNSPLQQSLSALQIEILKNAGNDSAKMLALSEVEDTYTEGKILYKKVYQGGEWHYEFSKDVSEKLFRVKFLEVGQGKGHYKVKNTQAIEPIFEFVGEENGVLLGNFEPIVPLVAPTQKAIWQANAKFWNATNSWNQLEWAWSVADKNLFSDIDDRDNNGFAWTLKSKQLLWNKGVNVDLFSTWKQIGKSFESVERINAIEFNREWNLQNENASQTQGQFLVKISPMVQGTENQAQIGVDLLRFGQKYFGQSPFLYLQWKKSKWSLNHLSKWTKSKNDWIENDFLRTETKVAFRHNKIWLQGKWQNEDNSRKDNILEKNLEGSQRFFRQTYSIGFGDSTAVFHSIEYKHKVMDSLSILENKFRKWQSNQWRFSGRFWQKNNSEFRYDVNYRILKNDITSANTEKTLQGRLFYKDHFWKENLQIQTTYERMSGNVAQQDFSFLEVPAGQGVYTWNDYNNNGIKEITEFEIAPYKDLAKYIKVFLPHQVFLPTVQNRLSQSVQFQMMNWQNQTGWRKFLSKWHNQTQWSMEQKQRNIQNDLNIRFLDLDNPDALAVVQSFRNTFYYNRGNQRQSGYYNFQFYKTKNWLSNGFQSTQNLTHQLFFSRNIEEVFRADFQTKWSKNDSQWDFQPNNTYQIYGLEWEPKLVYLWANQSQIEAFIQAKTKKEQAQSLHLKQYVFGLQSLIYGKNQFTLQASVSFVKNELQGNSQSPASFQMLEGLQNGNNGVWRLMIQKNIASFLDLNITYEGRKSENAPTIHTGGAQIRAFF